MTEEKHHLGGLNSTEKTTIRLSTDEELKWSYANYFSVDGLKKLQTAVDETRRVFNNNNIISDAKDFCAGVQGELQFRKSVTGKSPTP